MSSFIKAGYYHIYLDNSVDIVLGPKTSLKVFRCNSDKLNYMVTDFRAASKIQFTNTIVANGLPRDIPIPCGIQGHPHPAQRLPSLISLPPHENLTQS